MKPGKLTCAALLLLVAGGCESPATHNSFDSFTGKSTFFVTIPLQFEEHGAFVVPFARLSLSRIGGGVGGKDFVAVVVMASAGQPLDVLPNRPLRLSSGGHIFDVQPLPSSISGYASDSVSYAIPPSTFGRVASGGSIAIRLYGLEKVYTFALREKDTKAIKAFYNGQVAGEDLADGPI